MNNDKKNAVKQILDTIKTTFDFSDVDEVEKHLGDDFNISMGSRVEVKRKQTMSMPARIGVAVLIGSILCCGIEVSHNYASNRSNIESTEDKTLLGSIEDVLSEGLVKPVKEVLGIGKHSVESLVGGVVLAHEKELNGEKVEFRYVPLDGQCFVSETQKAYYKHDLYGKKLAELNSMFNDKNMVLYDFYTVYDRHKNDDYDNTKYFYSAAHNSLPNVFPEATLEDFIKNNYRTLEHYANTMEALKKYTEERANDYAGEKGWIEKIEKGNNL